MRLVEEGRTSQAGNPWADPGRGTGLRVAGALPGAEAQPKGREEEGGGQPWWPWKRRLSSSRLDVQSEIKKWSSRMQMSETVEKTDVKSCKAEQAKMMQRYLETEQKSKGKTSLLGVVKGDGKDQHPVCLETSKDMELSGCISDKAFIKAVEESQCLFLAQVELQLYISSTQ
uniref:Uncharacterized protein n=1 Tax=Sphaerodactylus townsendi TaxID=933632 RepID=A0ACB8EGV5_9SAUR